MFLSISVSFLAILFCFLRFPPSPFLFLSLALLPFGHAEAALPQHGHPGCPEEGKRPGSQRSSPPGRNTRKTGDLFLSSTSSAAPSGWTLWFYFPWKSCSQSSPPTLNLYLLYLFNCLCLTVAFREVFPLFFFSLPPLSGYVSLAADPQCGLQIRRKLYCLCFAVIQSRLQIHLSLLLHYQGDCNRGVFTVCTVSQETFKSSQVDFRVLPKLIIIIGCLG